jgi:hypothetical protein
VRVGGMRVRVMRVPKEESSPVLFWDVLFWDVLVSSPLNGCQGGILADGGRRLRRRVRVRVRVRRVRVRGMDMGDQQCSVRISRDVLVSRLHHVG